MTKRNQVDEETKAKCVICRARFVARIDDRFSVRGGKPAPDAFQGNWVGSDGSTIYMHADGKAGFKVGSKEVTGGGVEIDESAKTLTISLFGISNTWKIDQPPAGNVMVLSGTPYTKN